MIVNLNLFSFYFMMMPVDPIYVFSFSSLSLSLYPLTRRKTRMELVKLSLSVCGIELAYASETGREIYTFKMCVKPAIKKLFSILLLPRHSFRVSDPLKNRRSTSAYDSCVGSFANRWFLLDATSRIFKRPMSPSDGSSKAFHYSPVNRSSYGTFIGA